MATSLLDWITTLLKDSSAREAFQSDPKAAMSAAGMSSICGDDIRDARPFLLDNPSVKQVKPYEPADTSSAKEPHEQIRDIVESHKVQDSREYVASHGPGPREDTTIEDSYHKNAHESYNRSVQDNDEVTGPSSGPQSASADQGRSMVGNDQTSIGGERPVVGDNNRQWSERTDNSTDNDGNNITGDRNVGRDFNFEQGGAVFGQGIAGNDMDHVGGLVGLKDVVDIGNVNVLNVANLSNVLNNPAQDIFGDASPIALVHDLDLTNVLSNPSAPLVDVL
ncbi:MAG: IniB N-terminal domain-containing protein [Sporichthyaceae bacterium]